MNDYDSTRPAPIPPTESQPAGPDTASPFPSDTIGQTPVQAAAAAEASSGNEFPAIPGYEIRSKLGEGGMGVVYLAKQLGLNRDVAVKTLIGATVARATLARFWAEAEVMAEVKHPNVVQVIELGEYAGRPFMAMEFVSGGSLANRLRGGVQLPPRDAAELMEKVARGVAAAHDLGIVHRDLKPDNVLMDGDTPRVADFGIAKRKAHELTQTNAMMGTPAYMAPEQAASQSRHVGPAADVWSLGVMLYECLSGKRPFTGETVFDVLAKIATENPPTLRTLVTGIPRDLQTIVAKCLTKEPELRYATATELADDLGRFVRGEAIAARPAGVAERLVRWVRHKPTAAAAYGFSSLAVLLALVVFVVFGFWREAEGARDVAERAKAGVEVARDEAETARSQAEGDRGDAVAARIDADAHRGRADQARAVAEAAQARESRLRHEVGVASYCRTVDLAFQEWQDANPGRTRQLLTDCREELRNWEWKYVDRLCRTETSTTRISSSTAFVYTAASRDGTRVATYGGPQARTVIVIDVASGKRLAGISAGPDGVGGVAMSHDGRRAALITTFGTVVVWDIDADREAGRFVTGYKPYNFHLFLNPDGTRVCVLGQGADKQWCAKVWDAAGGADPLKLVESPNRTITAAFSPDGRTILTGGTTRQVCLHDANSGAVVWNVRDTEMVCSAAFSPSGDRILIGATGVTKLRDAKTGNLIKSLLGHASVTAVAFHPSGRYAATGGSERVVRVWNLAAEGGPLNTLHGATDQVRHLNFTPSGSGLRAADTSGVMRQWAPLTQQQGVPFAPPSTLSKLTMAAFSPDGTRVATAGANSEVLIWDVNTLRLVARLPLDAGAEFVAYVQDGKQLIVSDVGGSLTTWDATSGEPAAPPRKLDGVVRAAVSGPRGTSGLVSRYSTTVRVALSGAVWTDLDSGRAIHTFYPPEEAVSAVAISPDGSRVFLAHPREAAVCAYDTATGELVDKYTGVGKRVSAIAISPDGRRAALAEPNVGVHVVGVGTPRAAAGQTAAPPAPRHLLRRRDDYVPHNALQFIPDGTRVVVGAVGGSFTLWDTETGAETITLKGTNLLESLAFSSDGSRIVSAGHPGHLHLWETTPRKWGPALVFTPLVPPPLAPPPRPVNR